MPAGSHVGYDSTYTTSARTRIAVLDVGYADGYRRQLSNKGAVLLGGKRAPIIGVVSMNFVAVDLGPSSNVKPGDEAVLIGTQGDESVWADELAELCGTISYDILTGIKVAERIAR
jgi:alanine racemase